MKINDLLIQLDELNLELDSYAITSSGVLAIRKIREANDLDIIVTDRVWDYLAMNHNTFNEGLNKIKIGDIEILGKGCFYTGSDVAPVSEQISTADLIRGYPFVKLKYIKLYKNLQKTLKDLDDLKLIATYEANSKGKIR